MDPAATRTPTDATLARAAELAREFAATLPNRPVHATASLEELRSRFGGPLPGDAETICREARGTAQSPRVAERSAAIGAAWVGTMP